VPRSSVSDDGRAQAQTTEEHEGRLGKVRRALAAPRLWSRQPSPGSIIEICHDDEHVACQGRDGHEIRSKVSVVETISVNAEKSPQLRVLIVDDEALIRWSLSETLQDAGHAVIEAANAAEAVKYLSEGLDPDVIFLDYRLLDSQELTLLEIIRWAVPNSPVVMMTAYANPEVIAGAERLGAFRVVSKPFEMAEVPSLVRQAYRSRIRRDDGAGPGAPTFVIH
jgi:CheY-like chemotaxis protein